MGILIHFPERPERAGTGEASAGYAAQILFFTGVRYERHDDAAAPSGPARTRAARQGRPAIGDASRPRRRRG
jgi:hypothetical protein